MRTLIGAIISAIIPIGIVSAVMIWAGYWVVKQAVRKGIIEAYKIIKKENTEEE